MSEVRYESLLDSCCLSANVIGLEWKYAFSEDMSNTYRKEVKTLLGGTGFKFGGESIVKSIGKYEFPKVNEAFCCTKGLYEMKN